MALVSFIQIPPGFEQKFYSALGSASRFTFSRVKRNVLFSSRKRIKGMTEKSFLPAISSAWALLSPAEQTDWDTAGAVAGMTGWKLFVQDKSARIKNDIAGNATPSILHQSWVGKMLISNPAEQIKIAQYHPYSYYISKKVTGFNQREPVQVLELVSLPLTIGISWKTNLSIISGVTYTARFYAEVISLYQGRNISNIIEIPFGLNDDWTSGEVTLTSAIGPIKGYTIFLETDNVLGEVLFDCVRCEHNGQNWARDPNCNNIRQTFTQVYFQVPKNWAGVVLPEGTYYDSIYPTD
jgi:hypothetical protein